MLDIALAYCCRTVRLLAVTVVLTPLVHTGRPGLRQADADADGVGGGADRGACWGTVAGDGTRRGDAAGAGAAATMRVRTERRVVIAVDLTKVVCIENIISDVDAGDTCFGTARGGYSGARSGRGTAAGGRASRGGWSGAGTGRGAAACGRASRGFTVFSRGRRSPAEGQRRSRAEIHNQHFENSHTQASPILRSKHSYVIKACQTRGRFAYVSLRSVSDVSRSNSDMTCYDIFCA